MHVAVTGGTGLVGRHVVEKLEERGDEATVVSRSPDTDQVGWAPKTPGSLTLPEEIDALVHLAGAPIVGERWTQAYKEELYESRVQGTQRVVEAVREHGAIDHVVSASAVGYYGDQGDQVLDEDAEPGDDFLAAVCQEWEAAAEPIAEDPDLDTGLTVIRTGVVLSLEEGALAQMLNPFAFVKPFHWGLGGPVGDGQQWFPWIHVEDEARAIIHLLDEEAEGTYNLAAPDVVRNERFTQALASALGRPAKLPIPKFALRVLYGEAASVLFASQRVTPDRLQADGFDFEHPDVDEALEDLLGQEA